LKVAELDANELAPRSLRELKEQHKQQFFQDQIIPNQPLHIIAKSKKGEELMILRSGDMQMIPQESELVV
jgi:hypothetical protein